MKPSIDWAAARKRLEQTQISLEQSAVRSTEELGRIFRARAEALARDGRTSEASRPGTILRFWIGAAQFGIALERVAEAIRDPTIAPVPGSPKAVAGLIQVRGEVRSVWNIGPTLGLADASPNGGQGQGQIILVRNSPYEFGILVDRIEDVVADEGNLRETTVGSVAATITKSFVTVLDTKSLFEVLQQ
jgi:chemotaxis signal transduction protein